MARWRKILSHFCPVHDDKRMVINMSDDNEPRRIGDRIVIKCPVPGCNETTTLSEYQAQDD